MVAFYRVDATAARYEQKSRVVSVQLSRNSVKGRLAIFFLIAFSRLQLSVP